MTVVAVDVHRMPGHSDKIAPRPLPAGSVRIYEVYVGENTTYAWLCDACRDVRASSAKVPRPPKEIGYPLVPECCARGVPAFTGRCDDCPRAAASAAATFVATAPDSRLPTADEYPRPPTPPALGRKQKKTQPRQEGIEST